MANNLVAEAIVSSGSRFMTAEVTAYGDATTHIPGCFMAIVSGAEGSQTFAEIVGGAGAVSAGVQRMTLASDDPAVVSVQLIDDAIYTDGTGTPSKGMAVMGTDGTNPQIISTNATGHVNIADGGNTITVDGTVAISGTVTVGSHAVTNAGTFAVQVDGNALTALQLIDDPVFADDAAFTLTSSKVMMAGATRDDALSTLTAIEGDAVPLRVGSTGALWVGIEGTVTVGSHAVTNAGTFAVQAAQSGTWNITNVSGTVSLPTGASTAAKQPALGTAGTASTDVITVQGIASMTPILVTLSGTNNVTNAGTFAVQAACTNAGTFATQVDGAALTALQLIDNPVLVDDAAFTPATSSVMMAGFQADETATDSVDEGDAGAARMTLDRKLIVTPQPHTAGGCAIFRTLDLDETEEDVKTSAGQIYGIFAINTTNAALYLKVYNATAANVTVGTTTPVMTLPVPGNNDTDGAGFWLSLPVGIAFDTAISVAATTAVADNDTGAPGANALIVQVFYK